MINIDGLLSLLVQHGGSIVNGNSIHPKLVAQAEASNRLYIDDNSFIYIWEPPFAGRFPENDAEMDMWDWCYPLPAELPEELKTLDWFYKITHISEE